MVRTTRVDDHRLTAQRSWSPNSRMPLHITTGPEGTNNVMALAFGVLIVVLVIGGPLWIMGHLNHNMLLMDRVMQTQR